MSLVLLCNSLHGRVLTVENELNLHLNKAIAIYIYKIHFINTFGKTMFFFSLFCVFFFLAKGSKLAIRCASEKLKEHKWLSDIFFKNK